MSGTFYTTVEFAIVRAVSIGVADFTLIPDELKIIASDLRHLRNEAQSCINNQNRDNFIETCTKVWDLFSKLSFSTANKYALPGRYGSECFLQLLDSAARSMYAMEIGVRSVGANYILNGLKGVGKTTILHALGAIAACVCQRCLPIYWIYEKCYPCEPASPYTLITAARKLYDLEFNALLSASFNDLVLSLMPEGTDMTGTDKHNVSKCFLLFDELTSLYVPINSKSSQTTIMRRNKCVHVLSRFREIARKGDVIMMLSTSKINIKDYLFNPNSLEEMDGMYPDFNCALFIVTQIHPPRNVSLVQVYWKARYNEDICEKEAETVLYYTGGIGRWIDVYKTENNSCSNFHPGCLLNNSKLFLVCGLLLSTPVLSLFTLRSLDIDALLVNRWVDNMTLYCDGISVEYLTRQISDMSRAFFDNNEMYQQVHVFNATRKGFLGGNTRLSNKELLCSIIPAALQLENVVPPKKISFVQSDNSSIYVDGNPFTGSIECLCNQLLLWSSNGVETSIDGIWLQLKNNHLYVSGAQVKSGKETKSITSGVLTTQRMKRTSSIDDTTIAGILVHAERGFEAIVKYLSANLQCIVEVDKLVIFTNKTARSGYDQFWESNKEEMKYERFLMQHGISCDCSLYDGMDWIMENVSSDLAALLQF